MRLALRTLLGVIIGLALLAIFMPFIIGLVLEKNNKLLTNDSSHYKAEVIQYERHWFSSDVIVRVKLQSDFFLKIQTLLSTLPPNAEWIIKAHIQHGPFFYANVSGAPRLGLAVMDRSSFGMNQTIIKKYLTYLSFTGKNLNVLQLENLKTKTVEGIEFYLRDIQAKLWTDESHLSGDIELSHFSLGDDNTTIILPAATLSLNLKKDAFGLWIGEQDLRLSEIEMKDNNEVIRLHKIAFTGALEESKGQLAGNRHFTIEQVDFNDESIGPIQLELNIQKLNAKTIAQLFETYREISLHGEMYEFQLRQRLLALMPSLVGPDTMFQLKQFSVITPHGNLSVDLNVSWPSKNYYPQDNVRDVMQAAEVKTGFKVAIPLADKIINLLAKLTYTYQIPNEERANLVSLQNFIRLITQENTYFVLDLIEVGEIPKEEGLDLITKIRDTISLEDYFEEVKKLLFLRKIDLATAYKLNWLYISLYQQYSEFDKKIASQQQITEKLIQAQLNEYIKEGFILKENNEYKMTMTRSKSQFIVNGKEKSTTD